MLRLINKPISKLSILFVLSILAPGSILVYFSIQNIVSQMELTEKRLLEEQDDLAADLAEYFELKLTECANIFFNRADSLIKNSNNNIFVLDSMDCVDQVFLLADNGALIWPYYLLETMANHTYPKSEEFLQFYANAEKSEFAESNLREAARFYRNALKAARSEAGRARARNGLARVLAKRGLTKQAHEQYRILADRHGSLIDDSGLPFAYYAMHQLIRLYPDNPPAPVFMEIETILSNMLIGEIPLTNHTELSLQEISKWSSDQGQQLPQTAESIKEQITSIKELLSFALQHESSLQQYFSGGDDFATYPRLGSYFAVVGNTEDEPSLLLIKPKSDRSQTVGFEVNLAELKNNVVDYVSRRTTSFDSDINIVSKNKITQTFSDPLATVEELSPLVPSWHARISPKDPEMIISYVSKRRWLYGIALILLTAGTSLGIVLVLRDVSRERRLAQLRTDFVSNVSHELKTPLTSIRMLAETMRLGRIKKKTEVREYLYMIVNESERLTRLINNVLDFSKIEQRKKQYHLEKTNLSEVVKSVIRVMESTIKRKGFELKTDIASSVHTVADGDALQQAVLNLLSNAVKYSQKRKEISIRLWTENKSIRIEVADRGLGIPDSDQKRIFEKFYRAHSEHKQDTGGAGLGLTVVKHVVDAHDGRIELQSKVGEGTSFKIILPQRTGNNGEEV
jgi:signal transduction histidine kinase